MKKNNIIKTVCLILVVGLSIWSSFSVNHMTERRYFPKFDYEFDHTGLIIKASKESIRKTDTVKFFPVIDISSLNNQVIVNYAKMMCFISDNYNQPYGSTLGYFNQFYGLTFDKKFIAHCIMCGIINNNYMTRIPFILEIEYIKKNGKRTHKQAYMFEYLQRNEKFIGIRYVEKLNVRRLYNGNRYLIRKFKKQLSLWETEKETFEIKKETLEIIGYNFFPELNNIIDSTFSFN